MELSFGHIKSPKGAIAMQHRATPCVLIRLLKFSPERAKAIKGTVKQNAGENGVSEKTIAF